MEKVPGKEDQFARALQKRLQMPFADGFKIHVKKNLLYQLQIDATGKLRPSPRTCKTPNVANYSPFKQISSLKKPIRPYHWSLSKLSLAVSQRTTSSRTRQKL